MNYHIVQPGDSLWSISQAHGCSLQALLAANPQISNPNNITVGARINLPDGCTPESTPPPARPDRPPITVEQEGSLGSMSESDRDALCSRLRELPRPLIYVVKQDDNIYQLAKCFDLSIKEIMQVNPQIQNPDMIYPGDKIFIPRNRGGINLHGLNNSEGIRYCPTCGRKLE